MNIRLELEREGIDPDSSILPEMFELAKSRETKAAIISELGRLMINLKRMGKAPGQVFEDALPATVKRAKNAKDLLSALKLTADLAGMKIDPWYSMRYGIPSVLESISEQKMLGVAFNSALILAKAGLDPWALLRYSAPEFSACAKSKGEFQEQMVEIQRICLTAGCRHQDYLHRAIASISPFERQSKIRCLRMVGDLLGAMKDGGLEVEGVLQSIPSLAGSASDGRQLEAGLEVALAMAKKGMEPKGILEFGFPRAIEAAEVADPLSIELITQMAQRLIEKDIDPQDVLRYGTKPLMKLARSPGDLEKGFLALESLMIEMDDTGINPGATLFYGLRALASTCRSMDQLAGSLKFGARLAREEIDPCNNFKYGVAWAIGEINQSQFEAATGMAAGLIKTGIDPLIAMQYGVPALARASSSTEEFCKGMLLLERLMIAFEKRSIELKPVFVTVFSEPRSFRELEAIIKKIEKILADKGNLDYLQLCLEAALGARHLEFDPVMDKLMELGEKMKECKMDPWVEITYGVPPALAAIRSIEELEVIMTLAGLLVEQGMEPGTHLQHGLPAIAGVVTGNEFIDAVQIAIKLAENSIDPYEALHHGIPALQILKDRASISMALKLGLRMADSGLSPCSTFQSAVPVLAEREELEQYLNAIYELSIQLNEKKIDPSIAIASISTALAEKADDVVSFKRWCSRITALSPKLLYIYLKNINAISDHFTWHGDADWNRFVAALDLYSKGYWGDVQLDREMIRRLGSSGSTVSESVEQAREYFTARSKQRAAELGIHIDGLKHEDYIGLEALRGKITRKKGVAVERVLEKIARYGNCYSYFLAEQPHFYLEFKRETGNLAEGFDAPGIKFHVNYKVSAKMGLKSYADKMPVTSEIAAIKEVISELRARHERIYTRLYRQIRERGITIEKALEDEVSGENFEPIVEILLKELQNSEIEERGRYVLALIEAHAFRETEEIRCKIASQPDAVMKLNLLAEYWGHHIKAEIREKKLIGQKFYERHIAPLLNEKADIEKYLEGQIGKQESGTLSFVLSSRGISDLSKGDVSQDCLKDQLFLTGVAHLVDPAFFLFKIFEGEEWIGNVYAAICKDIEDRNVLFIDNLPVKTEHPILSGRKEDVDNFAAEFLKQIKSYASKEKFERVVIASDCSPRVRIKSALAFNSTPEKIVLRKVAKNMHFSEFGIQTEFIQAFGKLEEKQSYEVSGYVMKI